MEAPIRSVDSLRILQGVAERQARGRKGDGSFQRELGEEPGKDRGERPMPPPLQRQAPGIRKDPQDGSVHVDLLA